MRVSINPSSLKKCVNLIKIIKPVLGDYSININSRFTISSIDKRRGIVATMPLDGLDCQGEFILPMDRISVLESDLEQVEVYTTDKGLNLKSFNDKVTRNSVIRKRSESSKRPDPKRHDKSDDVMVIDSKELDNLLKGISCSASIKDTSTEEDMRINQVYFSSKNKLLYANARYYASYVLNDLITKDFSVVSADIPYIRAFCSRVHAPIRIKKDSSFIYFVDDQSDTYLYVSLVPFANPNIDTPEVSESDVYFEVEYEEYKKALRWVQVTLDGTSRVSLSLKNSVLSFRNGNIDLTSIPTSNSSGDFSADFPIKVLVTICDYIFDQDIEMRYDIKNLPGVIALSQSSGLSTCHHFLRSMKKS